MHCPWKILAIVPALNEADTVGLVVKEVLATETRADVVVVDDGSTDATAEVARAAGATVLQVPFQLGVGGAVRTGLRFARMHAYDVVVQVDGDGQHDARDIPLLVGQISGLDEAQVVVGSRFSGEGAWDVRGPRRWAMRLLAAHVSRVTGTRLTDVTSGFRALNRPAVILLEADYPAEYLFDTVEPLVTAGRAGARVSEVGVRMTQRRGGAPSQSVVRSTVYLLRVLFALMLSVIRRR